MSHRLSHKHTAIFGVTASLLTLVSCTDIFHSFDDLANLCGGAEACPADACIPLVDDVASASERACAWLGACEAPLGEAALGKCLIRARLAFDCRANPNQAPQGALATFWKGLSEAKDCSDVRRLVTGSDNICTDAVGFTSCWGKASPSNPSLKSTRIDCQRPSLRAGGEPCVLSGRYCAVLPDSSPSRASCTGSQGYECVRTGCIGTELHLCESTGIAGKGTIDRGVDCRLFGGASCTAEGALPTCLPASTTRCAATPRTRCDADGRTVIGCVSGLEERVNCSALHPDFVCVERDLSLGEVLSDACEAPLKKPVDGGEDRNVDGGGSVKNGSLAEGDECSPDGSIAVSRERFVAFRLNCSNVGLGPCTLVRTAEGLRSACSPPN